MLDVQENNALGAKHEHVDKQPDGKCYKSTCVWSQNGMHKYWKTEKINIAPCPTPTE